MLTLVLIYAVLLLAWSALPALRARHVPEDDAQPAPEPPQRAPRGAAATAFSALGR